MLQQPGNTHVAIVVMSKNWMPGSIYASDAKEKNG